MELNSVLELKQRVRQLADAGGFMGTLVREFGRASPLDISVGVGLTAKKGNFRLAVRIRQKNAHHLTFAAHVALMAVGEVDVRITGPVNAIAGCARGRVVARPLGIGASVGNHRGSGGTIGFFAKRRRDGAVGLVSNNHVLALEDLAQPDDAILHPSMCDGGQVGTDAVARLDGDFPRLKTRGEKEADCAFAVMKALPARPGQLDRGMLSKTIAAAADDMRVFKIGRTTDRTAGRIVAWDFDRLQVHSYHFGPARFENQIEIESVTDTTFGDRGDSGSLVFNSANQPVALLFAETRSGGTRGTGLHYAAPMQTVLDALQVDLVV